jgi:homoserine/homoserine lactone efflux protein
VGECRPEGERWNGEVSWQVWGLFALTELVLCVTPGPAVLLVLSQALGRGAARSVWSSLGILAANATYFIVSATSLGALLVASYRVFSAVRWLGAAYLVWLGLRTFFGRTSIVVDGAACPQPVRSARLFLNGFVLQASNPKSLVFFSAILPQFVDPRGGLVFQMTVLGLTSIVVEFVVLLGYGLLAERASAFARQPRYARLVDRLAGTLLITAGVGLAFLRR